ncbi:MAG TPA: hypothetical protein VGI47_00935 [Candidatus Binataceae bacterium]
MKKSLICALPVVLFIATGCASQTQSTPAPAAAAPAQSTPAPVEVRTNLEFGGPQVSIFHPDTRTLYLWSSDPRPGPPHRDPNCIKIQMSDSPSGGPVTNEPCS